MKRFKRNIMMLIFVVLISVGLLAAGILSSRQMKVTVRDVPLDGITQEVRLVLLSDLHGMEFGADNEALISLVRQNEPDLILLAGDMITRGSTDREVHVACSLKEKLREIAPVCFSLGNHETDYIDIHGDGVLDDFSASGAILMENQYADVTINGSSFRLGGMSELAYRDGGERFRPGVAAFLTAFCNTDLPTVLLSHRPEAFCFRKACAEWDVDLILSGHTHGGLVRLPLIGGLVAPIQGWFPKVDYGEYDFYGSKMIVTSGLAGYESLPRVFNPPEICLIKLIPPETESH